MMLCWFLIRLKAKCEPALLFLLKSQLKKQRLIIGYHIFHRFTDTKDRNLFHTLHMPITFQWASVFDTGDTLEFIFNNHLFLLRYLIFLGQLILVLAEVHDTADRRSAGRGNFNKIKTVFTRPFQGLSYRKNADLFSSRPDQSDRRHSNSCVDADLLLGYIILLSY